MTKNKIEKGKIEKYLHYIFGSKVIFRRFIIALITLIIGAMLLFGIECGYENNQLYLRLRPADTSKIIK